MDLNGCKVFVFGGIFGIGFVVVYKLIDCGCDVVVISCSLEKVRDVVGDGVMFEVCDVCDCVVFEEFFVCYVFFDILVCVVIGGLRVFGFFFEMDFDGYQVLFDKFWGYMNCV